MTPMAQDNLPTVSVNVFPGGFNWGVYVGQDKGFFSEAGIAVEVQGTPNSVTQMTDFSQAKFDIAMTAVDNIVAYVEGQGEAPIGPQDDFTAVMGSDSGFLSLVASPSVSKIEDLAGKTLSVDAMTTGYAFVLYEIMRRTRPRQGQRRLRDRARRRHGAALECVARRPARRDAVVGAL